MGRKLQKAMDICFVFEAERQCGTVLHFQMLERPPKLRPLARLLVPTRRIDGSPKATSALMEAIRMSKLTLTAARNSLLSTFELAQRRRIQITIACLFALWVSVPATAQQTMGDILGTVTDTSGAAVPGPK